MEFVKSLVHLYRKLLIRWVEVLLSNLQLLGQKFTEEQVLNIKEDLFLPFQKS